jgi:N4-(beta-N-acetylglucosaminyl)-L-asparaginase
LILKKVLGPLKYDF